MTEKNFEPQALVAKKIADEVVFRRFQGEGVLSLSRFHFSKDFIARSCFESDGVIN